MKRLLLLLLFAGLALAQNTLDPNNTSTSASGSISVSGSDCTNSNACVWIVAPTNGTSAAVQLSGTFTATLQFEKSVAGSVWVAATSTGNATSATSAGIYSFSLTGYRFLRVRASAYSAGPVVVAIGSNGGGSGSASASLPATTNLIKGDGLGNGADSGIAIDGSGNVAISASCSGGDTNSVCIGGKFRGDGSALTGISTGSAFAAVTDASPIAWSLGSAFVTNGTVTLAHATATRALNVSNLVSGGFYTLIVKQDSTGGAALTAGTGCTWLTPGGLGTGSFSIATTPSAINTISFAYDGTNCLVIPSPAYSAM